MKKPMINLDDVELQPRPAALQPSGETAERFDARMGWIAPLIGAKKLGYNLTSVPPGKRAFPFHNHLVNEEMFLILEGSGEVRIGDETYPLRKHDIVCCLAGDKNTAHQIINTGDVELTYLAVSTREYPEVAEYPDSGKFGLLANLPPDADGKPRQFMFIGRAGESINYWDGE